MLCGLEMFFLGLEFCNLFPEKLARSWCSYEKSAAPGINKAQNINFQSKVSSHRRRALINRSSVILKCLVIEFVGQFYKSYQFFHYMEYCKVLLMQL